MNIMKRTTLRTLLCATLMASLTPTAVSADAASPAFRMIVIEDASFVPQLLSGDYNEAIEILSAQKTRKRNYFATQTNVCVAYAKAKQVDKAIAACDAALAFAEKKANGVAGRKFGDPVTRKEIQTNLAVALSNRGVLFAVVGEPDQAKKHFETAIQLKGRYDFAESNNSRLENGPPMSDLTIASTD